MNIAIIPARGGSKRIPRKNIREFCGKPMIAYAIDAAKKSGLFDYITVSTEDQEVAEIAKKWGAQVPFLRPAELADDYTATVPVIANAINFYSGLGMEFDAVCCIYPGVPLIHVGDLVGALNLLTTGKADYCFPVAEYPSAIQRAIKILDSGKSQPVYPEFEIVRSQDLEPIYYDVGQFYWGKPKAWLTNSRIHSNASPYIIPSWRAVDLDTPDDWLRAELIYNAVISRII